MVGLENIKNNILNFVFYYLQNFDDDPEKCNEKILESIQQNWINEKE